MSREDSLEEGITELSGSHVSESGGEEKRRESPAGKTISHDTCASNSMREGETIVGCNLSDKLEERNDHS